MKTIVQYPDGARIRYDRETAEYVYVPANTIDDTDCEYFATLADAREYGASLTA